MTHAAGSRDSRPAGRARASPFAFCQRRSLRACASAASSSDSLMRFKAQKLALLIVLVSKLRSSSARSRCAGSAGTRRPERGRQLAGRVAHRAGAARRHAGMASGPVLDRAVRAAARRAGAIARAVVTPWLAGWALTGSGRLAAVGRRCRRCAWHRLAECGAPLSRDRLTPRHLFGRGVAVLVGDLAGGLAIEVVRCAPGAARALR